MANNITVRRQNAVEFFGRELGPIDHLDSNLQFLGYLDLASRASSDQERPINDLARSILQVTRFQERGTILRRCYNIPFTSCGDPTNAETGVCLIHRLNSIVLLVVQEASTGQSSCEPEAQVIAEAIAAFQHNNEKRLDLGLQSLESMTIPCITMVGTRPFLQGSRYHAAQQRCCFWEVSSALDGCNLLCSP